MQRLRQSGQRFARILSQSRFKVWLPSSMALSGVILVTQSTDKEPSKQAISTTKPSASQKQTKKDNTTQHHHEPVVLSGSVPVVVENAPNAPVSSSVPTAPTIEKTKAIPTKTVDAVFAHIASDSESAGKLEKLLQKVERIDEARDRNERTPLLAAVLVGKIEMVEWLLSQGQDRGVDVNAVDKHGLTALEYACWKGRYITLQKLLEKGATPVTTDAFGLSPLHKAAAFNQRLIVAKLLSLPVVDANIRTADVTAPPEYQADTKYETALHIVSRKGHIDTIQRLLDAGSSPNIQNLHGDTPMHLASKSRHIPSVMRMLDYGGNPSLKNKLGQTVAEACSPASTEEELNGRVVQDLPFYTSYSNQAECAYLKSRLALYESVTSRLVSQKPPSAVTPATAEGLKRIQQQQEASR